jgi:membrane protein DedA with SNARE-associated domain
MTETLLALVPTYGAPIIFVATYLSCLGLPIPASLVMLAGGAFVSSGDIGLAAAVAAAYVGAVLGDQTAFGIGRVGGQAVEARIRAKPARARLLDKARDILDRRGGLGVFFTRWLLAPIGPTVSIVAGGAGMDWKKFTIWDLAGEVLWVGIYIGLGAAFASSIGQLSSLLGNAVGAITAAAVAVGLGVLLVRAARRK